MRDIKGIRMSVTSQVVDNGEKSNRNPSVEAQEFVL